MRRIVKIERIEDAIPQKGVWYDYYGDIFISVIPDENINHIRRKVKSVDNKIDRKTSIWHLEWQYEQIEKNYGVPESGNKTYEVIVNVDGEKHIIDSLVNEKIAIEFQHTLSVDLEEMNSRFKAHQKIDLLPYLVIDLTSFSYSDYENKEQKISKKLNKWIKSDYYQHNNLFVDLSDCVLRLSNVVIQQHLKFSKNWFVKELTNLEVHFEDAQIAWQTQQKIDEKRRIANQQMLEEREEEREKRYLQMRKEENRAAKFNSDDYKYFRKCYRDKTIRPFILKYAKDLFSFRVWGEEKKDKLYEKCYSYHSEEQLFEISYTNYSLIEEKEIKTYWGFKKEKKYHFLYATILIFEGDGISQKVYEFEIDKGTTIRKR